MDCNKEEALRAKGIAEKKMEGKDFAGAKKIVLKAQQLFPELENVSQMLTVCEVHCSSEINRTVSEMDWYGILQVEQTADEISIKKQYRKLALLLHPDKNKFPGAEAAFKLIGEASGVLSNQISRSLYDMKRKTTTCRQPSLPRQTQQSSRNTFRKQAGVQNSSVNHAASQFPGFNQQQQMGTFWTVCPFCGMKYQYFQNIMNTALQCQHCKKPFIAHEIKIPGMPQRAKFGFAWNQSKLPQQKDIPSQGTGVPASTGMGFQGNVRKEATSTGIPPATGGISRGGFKAKTAVGGSDDGFVSSSYYPRRSSRNRQHVSYNEDGTDDDFVNSPGHKNKKPRADEVSEAKVQNSEISSGGDSKKNGVSPVETSPSHDEKEEKRKMGDPPKENIANGNKQARSVKEEEVKSRASSKAESSDTSGDATIKPEILEYPDPEFHDFDGDRMEENFAVDQIWAIYDNLQGMPRYYARVRNVFSSEFKLRITWLEPDPDRVEEIDWYKGELPVACGVHKNGKTETTRDRLMFSHRISCEKGVRRGSVKVYPRKGDIWALFKDWDINWSSDPDRHREYEYEIVEVIADFEEGMGITVVYMIKLKGFTSLFKRLVSKGTEVSFQVPGNELFRFSHLVPAYRMKGDERDNIPEGSLELDPASLPLNLDDCMLSKSFESQVEEESEKDRGRDSTFKSATEKEKTATRSEKRRSPKKGIKIKENNTKVTEDLRNGDDNPRSLKLKPASSDTAVCDTPDPEFHNFAEDRSEEKFKPDQIWAIYSNEDQMPRVYGRIKKVAHWSSITSLTWMKLQPNLEKDVQSSKEKLPIVCGMFTPKSSGGEFLSRSESFSHQIQLDPSSTKSGYEIYPRKGEVWAIYKNWNAEWKLSNLMNCEYEMVEILTNTNDDNGLKVLYLVKVAGFGSVFKARKKGGIGITVMVAEDELARFSHQVPAFRITEERGGRLRGFWELDPSALPSKYFCGKLNRNHGQ